MKVQKPVTFDLEVLNDINIHMGLNKITNFSSVVNDLVIIGLKEVKSNE